MRIKAIYRKNLKMETGKVASQVAHAVKNLGITPLDSDIIVLAVSDKKFEELVAENTECYVQIDKGLTCVEQGTRTAAAWIVKETPECPHTRIRENISGGRFDECLDCGKTWG